jgi:hypothetical protein
MKRDPRRAERAIRQWIARRRAELGWRAAVLDEEASRHVFRLRATRGRQRLPSASLRERSEQHRRERGDTFFVPK